MHFSQVVLKNKQDAKILSKISKRPTDWKEYFFYENEGMVPVNNLSR